MIARPARKLVEARDVYRIPLWVGTKLLYTVAPVRVLFRLARARGTLRWFDPRRRERVLARMERFYGETRSEAEVRRIAKRHVEYTGMREPVTVWPQIRGFAPNERYRIDGLEHVDAALAAGQGAILATMHFGYGHLIKPLLGARGYSAWVVGNKPRELARPSRFTRLGLFVHAQVLHLPQVSRPHPADLQAGLNVRPLLAALARNEILILAFDTPGRQGWGRHGSLRPMHVLGQEVLFAPGGMRLARRIGVPVLPAFVVDADGADPIGIRLEIGAPLSLQVTDSARADVQANLERFVSIFERYLERYPHLFRCTTTGTSEGLAVGEHVKVKGRLEPNGSFRAFMVEIRPKVERSRLKGKIEAIDEERHALRLLGRELALPAACELSDPEGLPISFADLCVGQIVRLTRDERGSHLAPTSLRLAVPRGNDLDELHGAVEELSPDRRSFQVLGFRVTTSETSKVKDRTGRPRGRPVRV